MMLIQCQELMEDVIQMCLEISSIFIFQYPHTVRVKRECKFC